MPKKLEPSCLTFFPHPPQPSRGRLEKYSNAGECNAISEIAEELRALLNEGGLASTSNYPLLYCTSEILNWNSLVVIRERLIHLNI